MTGRPGTAPPDPIAWLLKGGAAERHAALTRLLGAAPDAPQVQEARRAIMTEGPVPRILAAQQADGHWEGPDRFYTAKYRGRTNTLALDVSLRFGQPIPSYARGSSSQVLFGNLTFRGLSGSLVACSLTKGQMRTADFMATHPVFSLDEATAALAPPGGRRGTSQRLKHHLASGRLAPVSRGIYAVVPPGAATSDLDPDPLLVAAAARPDAVFAHHSAFELLGVAHSAWSITTVFTARRRGRLALRRSTVAFFEDPQALRTSGLRHLGTRRVEHRGRLLIVTGPERTLVEGLRRPTLAGGLEELLLSTGAFPTLDLSLLADILERYATARLWAAVGWFLERHQSAFSVPDSFLATLEARRPATALYLQRDQRGGTLEPRWNLVVPDSAFRLGASDER